MTWKHRCAALIARLALSSLLSAPSLAQAQAQPRKPAQVPAPATAPPAADELSSEHELSLDAMLVRREALLQAQLGTLVKREEELRYSAPYRQYRRRRSIGIVLIGAGGLSAALGLGFLGDSSSPLANAAESPALSLSLTGAGLALGSAGLLVLFHAQTTSEVEQLQLTSRERLRIERELSVLDRARPSVSIVPSVSRLDRDAAVLLALQVKR